VTLGIAALVLDTPDPDRAAAFWGAVLPPGALPFPLVLERNDAPKLVPNQMHFDITSQTPAEQAATVARVLENGGRHLDVGQGDDADHVVLADPDGNELCVIEPGNNFLADTGFVGCLSSDGSRAVGHFWAAALEWRLVWDQDEETAIQSPTGGVKISWGGPPYNPRAETNRFHLDLASTDVDADVARLVSLGATRIDDFHAAYVAMADPDGNQFCVVGDRS
jgi:catechol 2,3-dioxygenase-like lactoylglutathione lyase family enzyme